MYVAASRSERIARLMSSFLLLHKMLTSGLICGFDLSIISMLESSLSISLRNAPAREVQKPPLPCAWFLALFQASILNSQAINLYADIYAFCVFSQGHKFFI